MRIFTDHCVHNDVVDALRKQGFKIEKALEVELDKTPDGQIFEYTQKTSQVLLTADKDFGNIVRFNIRNSPGVVMIYTYHMSRRMMIDEVVKFFKETKEDLLRGRLSIIQAKSGIRYWPK